MLSNLKATLAARRMRQFELAAELKISASTLTEIILGRRPLEDGQRTRIGVLLGVEDLEWLFLDVRPRPAARPAGSPPVIALHVAPGTRA